MSEFLETKRNIQGQQLEERMGEQDALSALTKQFKPITDAQSKMTTGILKELVPLQQSSSEQTTLLKDLPRALKAAIPPLPSILGDLSGEAELASMESLSDYDDEPPEMLGKIAESYLRKFATKDADKTYSIYDKSGSFFIGDAKVGVIDNNIIVGDKEYQGTPGLWELIVMNKPDNEIYTQEDYENYADIMINSNALRQGHKKDGRPLSSRGWKWNNLLKDIWSEKGKFGKGLVRRSLRSSGVESHTIVLPSDPNVLLERLDLLLASKAAGNTGVRNEIVSICDELKRQNVLDTNTYKNLMSVL